MTHYRAEQTIAFSGWQAGEIELTQVVTYTVSKYRAATLEQPEEPATAEVIECRYSIGKTELHLGDLLTDTFEAEESFTDWLLNEASESDEYDRDCAADAKREDRANG